MYRNPHIRSSAIAVCFGTLLWLSACADDRSAENTAEEGPWEYVDDGRCANLDCGDGGHCDMAGTCVCDAGTWFDGARCVAVSTCASPPCPEECVIPQGPTLRAVLNGDTLTFSDGETAPLGTEAADIAVTAIEVGVSYDISATSPDAWVAGNAVTVQAPHDVEYVRVFARVTDNCVGESPYFHQVYRVHEGGFPTQGSAVGWTAVPTDDERLQIWADEVVEFVPGARLGEDWSDTSRAIGPASRASDDVLSLGEGGTITVALSAAASDIPGADIVVFENAFNETFLEFARVEVSSNGLDFAAFDISARGNDAIPTYGSVDTSRYSQVAGAYASDFGTGFDLATLRQHAMVMRGLLDLTSITHVRVTDIVGDGSEVDGAGHPVYDPTPTFDSAGFDIDAVGAFVRDPL